MKDTMSGKTLFYSRLLLIVFNPFWWMMNSFLCVAVSYVRLDDAGKMLVVSVCGRFVYNN